MSRGRSELYTRPNKYKRFISLDKYLRKYMQSTKYICTKVCVRRKELNKFSITYNIITINTGVFSSINLMEVYTIKLFVDRVLKVLISFFCWSN